MKRIAWSVLFSICLFSGGRTARAYTQYAIKHPNIGGLIDSAVRRGGSFDPMEGVLAYDYEDGYLTNIVVSGSVDVLVPGDYTLTYSVTDSSNDVKTIERNVVVLPPGAFARLDATGRRGPGDVISLDASYTNRLVDGLTYVKPVFSAVRGTRYEYQLIERDWDDAAYTNVPPTPAEWAAVSTNRFHRDLYLCMRPRRDRWLKMVLTCTNSGERAEWIFGLKGDPGVLFHSPLDNADHWRLSREVDDSETASEQAAVFEQLGTFWCPLSLWKEKALGGGARYTTIGSLKGAYKTANREELHGFYTTIRAFMSGVDKRSQSDANWAKIQIRFDHAFGVAMNASYRRSFQMPMSEMNGGDASEFIRHFTNCYAHLRATYNPDRIIIATALRGQANIFAGAFSDATNAYFLVEWHKGHFDSMYRRLPTQYPYRISYPRINEVWSAWDGVRFFETHRNVHKMAQSSRVGTAILDKCGIMASVDNGDWSILSRIYYAMWFNYSGYDYLNKGDYFADDWDGDGISNQQERTLNTNPFNPDTDGDWIYDSLEVRYGLDPLDPADGTRDDDGDGLSNFEEILLSIGVPGAGTGTPAQPPLTITLPDGTVKGMDPNNPSDAFWDPDGDLLPLWYEFKTGSNPRDLYKYKTGIKGYYFYPDVSYAYAGTTRQIAYFNNIIGGSDLDGDGVKNGVEIEVGMNPLDASDAAEDWDGDGVVNSNEIVAGTAPFGDETDAPIFDGYLTRGPVRAREELERSFLFESVSAPNPGIVHVYAKLSGPDWLEIAASGRLSGVPSDADVGENVWEVEVLDNLGRAATNTLHVKVESALPIPNVGLTTNGKSIANGAMGADFGRVTDGDFLERSFEIHNTGAVGLEISALSVSGDGFALARDPDFSIPSDSSSVFVVRFSPQVPGISTGRVEISSNDPDEPLFSFLLSGDAEAAFDFLPNRIPGCILWLDASDLDADGSPEGLAESGLTNATGVWRWRDKSGSSNDALASATNEMPSYFSEDLSGHSVVHFDGVDDNLSFNALTNIRTAFWLLREPSEAAGEMHFFLGDSVNYDFHRGGSGNLWSGYTSSFVTHGSTRLNGTVVNGKNTPLPSGSYNVLSVLATGPLRAGRISRDRGMKNRTWSGEMAEILLFDRALSAREVRDVETYLENKWHPHGGAPLSYGEWVAGFSLGGATNLLDDPDGDGTLNLSEYALGRDPSVHDAGSGLRLRRETNGDVRVLYSRRRFFRSLGLEYVLESSTNLSNSGLWTGNDTIRVGFGSESATFECVTNVPIGNPADIRFFRLRVQRR